MYEWAVLESNPASVMEVFCERCSFEFRGPLSDFRLKSTCMPKVAQVSDLDLDTADEKAREMGFPSFPRD